MLGRRRFGTGSLSQNKAARRWCRALRRNRSGSSSPGERRRRSRSSASPPPRRSTVQGPESPSTFLLPASQIFTCFLAVPLPPEVPPQKNLRGHRKATKRVPRTKPAIHDTALSHTPKIQFLPLVFNGGKRYNGTCIVRPSRCVWSHLSVYRGRDVASVPSLLAQFLFVPSLLLYMVFRKKQPLIITKSGDFFGKTAPFPLYTTPKKC